MSANYGRSVTETQLLPIAAPYPTSPRPRSAMRRVVRRFLRDSAYVLTGLPLALITFVMIMTGFAAGAGLLVTVIGLPILAGTLLLAGQFAAAERIRLGWLFDEPVRAPAYKRIDPREGFLRRAVTPLTDGQRWLDLGHAIFGWIIATISWCFVLTWWCGAVSGLLYFSYDWALQIPARNDPGDHDLLELMNLSSTPFTRITFFTAAGIVFTLTLPLVARGFAALQGGIASGMLTNVNDLHERIEVLTESRQALASAEADALRRIERDIHDGPQQRLVRLAMDLSRADRQLATDPVAARATIAEALTQTRETLDELRALSRGIAPPILADRGLPGALAALAARSAVPIDLDVDLAPGQRLPSGVENTVYFIVAEALTNIAKHSGANRAKVAVALSATRGHPWVTVRLGDDGVGGASLGKGHGLAGLVDRVQAHDGSFVLDSPAGGPTLIEAQIPCG
jgi:signal transduction histidine kinase